MKANLYRSFILQKGAAGVTMKNLFLILVSIAAWSSMGHAATLFVAQNAAGANSGADCADAHSAAWFNTASNWGSGVGQIGPGTTVHLCGAFTGAAGSTMLTIQGSGASGQNIVIQSDSGSPATLSAPYWNANHGAIYCSGLQYITLDGNNNGVIQNTANGQGLSFQQQSVGIVDFCSNSVVQNWTVANIYTHQTATHSDCGGA